VAWGEEPRFSETKAVGEEPVETWSLTETAVPSTLEGEWSHIVFENMLLAAYALRILESVSPQQRVPETENS
jgi:hypothetical protein